MFIVIVVHRRDVFELLLFIGLIGIEIFQNSHIRSSDLVIGLVNGQTWTNQESKKSNGPYVIRSHTFLNQLFETSHSETDCRVKQFNNNSNKTK